MRRILLWALTTVSTVVLLFGYRTSTSTTLPTGTEAAGNTPTTTPFTSARTTTSTYTGTVTGTTADTRWGPVQVRATLAAGRITAVDVVQYPTANHKDQEINADAIPTLVQETLEAQSADIDVVSGATVTSDGYLQSLQSVLDQAGVA
jgi:uncharacterized protein with FMN-binding domain